MEHDHEQAATPQHSLAYLPAAWGSQDLWGPVDAHQRQVQQACPLQGRCCKRKVITQQAVMHRKTASRVDGQVLPARPEAVDSNTDRFNPRMGSGQLLATRLCPHSCKPAKQVCLLQDSQPAVQAVQYRA